MSLRFILGRAGTGKSTLCLNEITQMQKDGLNERQVLIVPEQYTLQAEKDLLSLSPSSVTMNAQVLSFKRLAYRVFSVTGIPYKNLLTKTAKTMLLRKILFDVSQELCYYTQSVDKKGFVSNVSEAITELFRYGQTPEAIRQQIEGLDKRSMQMKFNDISLIYDRYVKFLEDRYISSDEELSYMADKIGESKFCANIKVWIDGFYGFTPQEYRVINELLKAAGTVTIALTVDSLDYNSLIKKPSDTHPFYQTRKTFIYLNNIALRYNHGKDETVLCSKQVRYTGGLLNDIAHLETNYTRIQPEQRTEISGNIRILAASNRYAEMKETAAKVIGLVRDSGYRFRDIAVITRNRALQEYRQSISEVFNDYGIPFFYDLRRDSMANPLISLVRASLEIVVGRWSYESVFSCLKTYLHGIQREVIDKLENYVLAYGIRGKRWDEDWSYGFDEDGIFDMEEIYSAKESILKKLGKLKQLSRSKKYTVREITMFIIDYLSEINIEETLSELVCNFADSHNESLAGEYRQIWDKLMETLDKMVEILGDEKITLDLYIKIFDSGMSENDMGLIPPGIDQVIVGDLERTRLPKIKAMFIIGANEGILPERFDDSGLITDNERLLLEGMGKRLADDSKRKTYQEQFLIYMALTTPTDYLQISYACGGLDGKAMQPSVIIGKIKKIFPSLTVDSDLYRGSELEKIVMPRPALGDMLNNIRKMSDGIDTDDVWADVFSWGLENEEWRDTIRTAVDGIFITNVLNYVTASTVGKLYGKEIYTSVSRLERFMSCPFSYYVQYGLRVNERRIYKLQTPDLGVLFHNIIDSFSKELAESGVMWRDLSRDDINTRVSDAVERLAPEAGAKILLSSSRHKYLIQRLKRISQRAIYAMAEHIKAGSFEPLAFEIGFGANEKLPPIVIRLSGGERLLITGRIDRVDIMRQDGSTYVKIIDYKSGNKSFSLQDLYYGLQLQLMLYLDAFLKSGGSAVNLNELLPGGVFYFRIDDPLITLESDEIDDEQIEELLLKSLKMSGLVLGEEAVIRGMDSNISGHSAIIPVMLKKDGSVGQQSQTASKEEFADLCQYVNDTIKSIGDEIVKGNIKVSPFKDKDMESCTYCGYSSICRFDKRFEPEKYRRLMPLKKEELWEKIISRG